MRWRLDFAIAINLLAAMALTACDRKEKTPPADNPAATSAQNPAANQPAQNQAAQPPPGERQIATIQIGQSPAPGDDAPMLPTGDPAALPKVQPVRSEIHNMLKERFGSALVRNLEIEVHSADGGSRVVITGEVPDEQFRLALAREIEVRVQNLKGQDISVDLAGEIPRLFSFPANVAKSIYVVFSPDLSVAVTSQGDIYEVASGLHVHQMMQELGPFYSMAYAPSGAALATGMQGGGILLWNMPEGASFRTLAALSPNAPSNTGALQFSMNGAMLASIHTDRGEVMVWDMAVEGGRVVGTHSDVGDDTQRAGRYRMAVPPNGDFIASVNASEKAITLWDLNLRSKVAAVANIEVKPEAMVWSQSGKILAVARGAGEHKGIVLFDTPSFQPRALALPHDAEVDGLAITNDDRTLAASIRNHGVVLWDLATGNIWQTIEHAKAGSGDIVFSQDGAVLVTVGKTLPTPAIRLWDVSQRPGAPPRRAGMPPTIKY